MSHECKLHVIYFISALREKRGMSPGWLQSMVFAEKEIDLNLKKEVGRQA